MAGSPRVPAIAALLVAVACSGGPGARSPAPDKPAAPREVTIDELDARRDELRARCHAHHGDRDACARDRTCVVGPPRTSCSGHVCTDGGPSTCLPCLDMVALMGRFPPELCAARASGRDLDACRLLHPGAPQRCVAPPS